MAGIMVMDEFDELQERVKGLEAEMETLRARRDEALQRADSADRADSTGTSFPPLRAR